MKMSSSATLYDLTSTEKAAVAQMFKFLRKCIYVRPDFVLFFDTQIRFDGAEVWGL